LPLGRHPELDSGSHLIVVLESGEIPNQVWNDIYIYFLRPFIIVFFFDLSTPHFFTCNFNLQKARKKSSILL